MPVLNFAVGIEVFGGLSVVLLYMFAGLKETTKEEDEAEPQNFAQTEELP